MGPELLACGNTEHCQFWGDKQPNILKCLVGGFSPSKGRQVGKQGDREGGTAKGTPNFSATGNLFLVRPMTVID